MTRSDKPTQNNKNPSQNTPRRSWVGTTILPNASRFQGGPPISLNEVSHQSQAQTNSNRRSEVLRNLQERVPGLRVPNYIEIIDDEGGNAEPARLPNRPNRRNTIDTPMDPEEG